jgi:hypothetical protein
MASSHYSTELYSNSNNKRGKLSEPIHNQYRHSAIITTATTPIERVSTTTASHLTESNHTLSMSITTDTIERINTLSNGRPRNTLLFGRVAAMCNETVASSNYDSNSSSSNIEGDNEFRRRLTRGLNMDRSHSTSSLSLNDSISTRSNQIASINHTHNNIIHNGNGLSTNRSTNRFRAATTHDYFTLTSVSSTHISPIDRELLGK